MSQQQFQGSVKLSYYSIISEWKLLEQCKTLQWIHLGGLLPKWVSLACDSRFYAFRAESCLLSYRVDWKCDDVYQESVLCSRRIITSRISVMLGLWALLVKFEMRRGRKKSQSCERGPARLHNKEWTLYIHATHSKYEPITCLWLRLQAVPIRMSIPTISDRTLDHVAYMNGWVSF